MVKKQWFYPNGANLYTEHHIGFRSKVWMTMVFPGVKECEILVPAYRLSCSTLRGGVYCTTWNIFAPAKVRGLIYDMLGISSQSATTKSNFQSCLNFKMKYMLRGCNILTPLPSPSSTERAKSFLSLDLG